MLHKKYKFIAILIIPITIFIVYWFFDANQSFPKVKNSYVMPSEQYGALSSDGIYLYTSTHKKINLQNGSESFIEFITKSNLLPAFAILDLSPNGNYLTAQRGSLENYDRYLLDLQAESYQKESNMCISWSGNSKRCLEFFNFHLVEMPENKIVEGWSKNEDFRDVDNISGDYIFLWDTNKNIPIAEIYPCDTESKETFTYCLVSLAYDRGRFNLENKSGNLTAISIFEVPNSMEVVSYIFDPTGQYILFAVWEHNGEYIYGDYDTDTVSDTALILVDWRNKKSQEIFRLSNITLENVAVSRGSSSIQWSSDGSTILISRNNAPAIVLKLK